VLSVFLRASAVIAVIFLQSPHRAPDGPTPEGLRRGFDALESSATDVSPLARLWGAIPPETRKDAIETIAGEASGGWLRPITTVADRATSSVGGQKGASPLWRDGPLREARRVYP
jgi:hypothetical protein